MASRHRARQAPRPGDRLVRAGGALFAVGLLFTLLTFGPFFFGVDERPLVLSLGALLAPVGFGLALAGLVRQARSSQRAAAATTSR